MYRKTQYLLSRYILHIYIYNLYTGKVPKTLDSEGFLYVSAYGKGIGNQTKNNLYKNYCHRYAGALSGVLSMRKDFKFNNLFLFFNETLRNWEL